jgi:hypothetical protein
MLSFSNDFTSDSASMVLFEAESTELLEEILQGKAELKGKTYNSRFEFGILTLS